MDFARFFPTTFEESFVEYCKEEINACGGNQEEIDEFNQMNTFDKKCGWLSNYLFGVLTYDGELDIEFGKTIYYVMKAILDRNTFKYIDESSANYRNFIIVCNLLDRYKLIEWGTSIRGSWFTFYEKNDLELSEESINRLLNSFMLQ